MQQTNSKPLGPWSIGHDSNTSDKLQGDDLISASLILKVIDQFFKTSSNEPI